MCTQNKNWQRVNEYECTVRPHRKQFHTLAQQVEFVFCFAEAKTLW